MRAAICSSIGASFGGSLAITGSSGPGIALKGEAIGLATMLELPLVIVNVQRAGPSTGLPRGAPSSCTSAWRPTGATDTSRTSPWPDTSGRAPSTPSGKGAGM